MLTRTYPIQDDVNEMSVFLFGARKTGKSTYLRMLYPDAPYIDLLNTTIRNAYRNRPASLYNQFKGKDANTIVIIDEIQEVPDLLNEVHRLIAEFDIRFILCGSSARKLKRNGYNTLGGRAYPCTFYPLVSAEIPDFDIDRAVNHGMLPQHYLSPNPTRLLSAYIDVYLQQEIKAEAIVRKVNVFERFLEVAALTDGEIVNYSNIASDCQINSVSIKQYFEILQDTLIGYMIPAYTKVVKRKLVQAPRFYYFDIGVANYLLHRKDMIRGTIEYGHAFEHIIIQELVAYLGYTHDHRRLSYWHTYAGNEVDAIIGDAELAIEIKSAEEAKPKHFKGLHAFHEEHPSCRLLLVSLDPISRVQDEIELFYVYDFLRQLWAGKLF